MCLTQTEHDNSTIRDLQYLQASMLWLDIAAFCGFRRKMEIAESSLLPLVTVRLPNYVLSFASLINLRHCDVQVD